KAFTSPRKTRSIQLCSSLPSMQKINCWLLVLPCVAPWHYFTCLFNGNSLEPPGWKPVLE
ncbi:MAG: hypothetical protein OEV22_06640, partial [Deltaproteobacteria bacterium]|nr:hypothetical protein [Deltaproteobacteria bacterium]